MKRRIIYAPLFLFAVFGQAHAGDTVYFAMKADMPTLRDKAMKDTFSVDLTDKQIEQSFKVVCEAGQGGIISSRNQSCAVSGSGALINPNGGAKLQRTQYAGGWIVKSDGFTDASIMSANYLAVGKVGASASAFSGALMLKPENPSSTASSLRDSIMKNFSTTQSGVIDTRVDTIQFVNFTIPSAGLPSDKGCVWNGDMVYAYQTTSWFIDVKAKCNGKEFPLKGNMPFTQTKNVGNQHQYDLTLTLPSNEAEGNDALFAKATGDADLFAGADGISGQIIMKESSYVDVTTGGETDKVPANIDATGTLNGQNVPIEAVRSFGEIIAILSRTFFGA